MTNDPPAPGELQRSHLELRADVRDGFAQLNARLDRLVTSDAFAAEQRRVDDAHHAEQRRVDDKLRDLADDIAAERDARKAAEATEAKARTEGDARQQEALNKLIANQKWLVVAVLLPIAFFIANIVIGKG